MTADGARLDMRRALELTQLKATLQVRILRDDSIGKVVRYRFRLAKPPSSESLCPPPGQASPTRC